MPTEIEIGKIKVGSRIRKHLEGIEGLMDSIREVGLLHPIVLNKRRELVAGGRRLEAVKRMGWKSVPVRIIADLNDAMASLKAEHDENASRVPLKPSEMGEFGKRLEELEREAAKGRHREGSSSGGKGSGKLPEPSTGDTRDKVGFVLGVSGKTYEAVRTITDEGTEALKEAVDAGTVSISAGAELAKMPPEQQEELIAAGPDAVKEAAKKAKAERKAKPESKPEPVNQPEAAATDSGTDEQETIPFIKQVEAVCREFDQIKARVEAWKEHPEAYAIHFPTIVGGIERLRQDLWSCRLSHDCPYCAKNGKPDCKGCRGTRKVTKTAHTQGERSMNKYGGAA